MVMEFLNELFSKFDDLCDSHRVYKVETAGDCYIVAGALMALDEEGFITLDQQANGQQGAHSVVAYAQVGPCLIHREVAPPSLFHQEPASRSSEWKHSAELHACAFLSNLLELPLTSHVPECRPCFAMLSRCPCLIMAFLRQCAWAFTRGPWSGGSGGL